MNRAKHIASIATALIALAPALALAQQKPAKAAPAAAHPDLSGFWGPSIGKPDPALMAKLPPNTVVLDDTGAPEFPQGEYGGLKLKPGALAKAQKWKPEDEMTISRTCSPPSSIYAIQGPFPFEIYQTPQLIVFKYEYYDQVRLVFMDGRGHPADAPHTKTGHSIGHWEGDELVVDTRLFEPSTITNNGLEHSENIHMVERYRLSPDHKTLMASEWFEDPEVLDNNGARYIQWKAKPGNYVYPYDCDPSFALNYKAK